MVDRYLRWWMKTGVHYQLREKCQYQRKMLFLTSVTGQWGGSSFCVWKSYKLWCLCSLKLIQLPQETKMKEYKSTLTKRWAQVSMCQTSFCCLTWKLSTYTYVSGTFFSHPGSHIHWRWQWPRWGCWPYWQQLWSCWVTLTNKKTS